MHAWVAGASGLVGKHLVADLLDDPAVERVTTLVRRATGQKHPKLTEQLVDFERLELELPSGTEPTVFCCLGTTRAKAGSEERFRRVDYEYPMTFGKIAAWARAENFLVVSSLGSDPNSRLLYCRVKGELERDLQTLNLHGLRIFRPSLLLGQRSEHRTGERFAQALAQPLLSLMRGPLRAVRPIHASLVARAMLWTALRPPPESCSIFESSRIAEIAGQARSALESPPLSLK